MKLWQKILIAMFLGAVTGLFLPGPHTFLKTVGDGFLSLVHMLILPLIFASITVGITSIHDPGKLGRVGSKTILLYLSTTALSVLLGVATGYLAQPKKGEIHIETKVVPREASLYGNHEDSSKRVGLGDLLTNIIPKNPIKAFVDGNVLQVIFFSVLLGLAINFSPQDRIAPLIRLFQGLASVMLELTQIVMKFSPYGIFAIVAWATASFGMKAIYSMIKFLIFYYAACLFHMTVTLGILLKWGAKISLKRFVVKSWDALVMAFSTCSSSATLPIALDCLINKMGVGKAVASFMLPLGTAINMNGAAIYQGMSALFLCGVYGIDLGLMEIVELVVVAVCSALGSAGVPGTGFIMLSVVLSSVGLPLEGLALLAGIDRVREMISTVTNISSDIACCLVVAKQEGELSEEILLSDP